MVIGEHDSFVHPGKRLILGILQQARRAHRERVPHDLQQPPQPVDDMLRQGRFDESPYDLFVIIGSKSKITEVVMLHHGVKNIGFKYDRRGDIDIDTLEFVMYLVAIQESVHEGQAASLAAKRTAADAGEATVRIKCPGVVVGYPPSMLLDVIAMQRRNERLSKIIDGGKVVDRARPQLVSKVKLGPRFEPIGEVVAFGVEKKALVGDHVQLLFEIAQIMGAGHFTAVGHIENEITEAEIPADEPLDIMKQPRRILHQE